MNKQAEFTDAPNDKAVWTQVGRSRPHESERLHVSGEATYVDDVPELQGTLHAALGMSGKAHARITSLDLMPVRDSTGVIAVLTADDIPGLNDCGPIIHDDPILAKDLVQYIFIVVADSHDHARQAARNAKISYAVLPAILTPQQARQEQSFVLPPMRLQRGNVSDAFAASSHTLKGNLFVGGQEQFYLEGQISYAIPREENSMQMLCSTQHPSEMQRVVAHALGISAHRVTVECRRMGGGFGGKESQSALWAAAAAISAAHVKRPVKLRADRDDDMLVTGKRHCFQYDYEMGFDNEGRITGAKVEMVLRSGFSADLSGPVATLAICHVDNCCYLPHTDLSAMRGKTHTQSNTAFRGFGGPQGAIVTEYMIDGIPRNLGQAPLDIRRCNFYGSDATAGRNVTPYGQVVEDNVIHELVDELEKSSTYRARREDTRIFNAQNPILKKGIALTPAKFGISFNVNHLNQAGALVHVYLDGSVLVSHGGTEMGQGINTKIMQVVAYELGITLDRVRTAATDTSKVANTSATAASTGTDLNEKAAQDAARQIRERLAMFAAGRYGVEISTITFADCVGVNGRGIAFEEIVNQAYLGRVQLWSDGFYATPGLHWDAASMSGRPFSYFAYGAAVSEVVVDTLTGEWKCLRTDILYDAGESLNPAIDIGQVEGAFIQGMGWLTTEELWWNADGKLMTHAPSTYKIPTVSDCPKDFRVHLYRNSNGFDSIHRSKAVGEPPLLLAFSVFFAIRGAIASVGDYRINPPLNAPATCEEILNAVDAVNARLTSS